MKPVEKNCVRSRITVLQAFCGSITRKTKPKLNASGVVQYQELICLHVSALIVVAHNAEQHRCHTPEAANSTCFVWLDDLMMGKGAVFPQITVFRQWEDDANVRSTI